MSLIKELQRRNVFRVAAAYLAVAWLLLEVGATLEPAMHLPDWVDSVLAFFLLLGFPIALFFSWAYELTPEGLKREGDVDAESSVRALNARKWDRLIIVVLVLVVAYFAIETYVLTPRPKAEPPVASTEPEQQANNSSGTPDSTLASPVIPMKSIAVLPFVNMSSDPEQEYFSDGLTEELLNLLAGIKDLKVAARTSSFYYKDKLQEIPLTEVARQLEVAHVLEGSVRKGGNKVRITAQLIKADDGYHLWSQTYDRELDDIFSIQDEISAAVVDALKVTLLGEAPKATVIDTESWELTQQARFFYNRRADGDMQKAFDLYQRAVEIDPHNAMAWVGIAPLYYYLFDPPRREDAMAAVDKALAIEPDNPEAMIRKAGILEFQGQPEQAQAMRQRALEAGPDNVLVLGIIAGREMAMGNVELALELQRRAVSLDPLHATNLGNLAGYLIEAGQIEEAKKWALRQEELAPESARNGGSLATIALFEGDYDTAQRRINDLKDEDGPRTYMAYEKTMLQAMLDYSRGDEAASLSELEYYRQQVGDTFPIGLAYIHAWRGELEEAWDCIDQALELSPDGNWVQYVKHAFLEPLHDDPRWDDLMAHFRALQQVNPFT